MLVDSSSWLMMLTMVPCMQAQQFSLGLTWTFQGIGFPSFSTHRKDHGNYFKSTFDGQGHIISNLVINTSNHFVSLFVVTGTSFTENVVLDSSCSVLNCFVGSSTYLYTAWIISYLNSWNMAGSKVVVEGCVNMASVTFTGNTTRNDDSVIVVGGVIAFFLP